MSVSDVVMLYVYVFANKASTSFTRRRVGSVADDGGDDDGDDEDVSGEAVEAGMTASAQRLMQEAGDEEEDVLLSS